MYPKSLKNCNLPMAGVVFAVATSQSLGDECDIRVTVAGGGPECSAFIKLAPMMTQANIALCSDCFHDARFVPGHSSLDFQRVDGTKDGLDNNGDSWTDDETVLLLEGVEKYNDN